MNGYTDTNEWSDFLTDKLLDTWALTISKLLHKNNLDKNKFLNDVQSYNKTIPHDIKKGLQDILNGRTTNTDRDPIEVPKARFVLGRAVATLLFDTEISAYSILSFGQNFLCCEGIQAEIEARFLISENIQLFTDRFCSCIDEMSKNIRSFCLYHHDFDLLDSEWHFWRESATIRNIFEQRVFEVHLSIPCQNIICCLLPNYIEKFLIILPHIPFPSIIRDILYCIPLPSEILPLLLKKSPLTRPIVDDDIPSIRYELYLTPLLIQSALNYGTAQIIKNNSNPNALVNLEALKSILISFYDALVQVISERSDGNFLALALQAESQSRLNFYSRNKYGFEIPWKCISNSIIKKFQITKGTKPGDILSDTVGIGADKAKEIISEFSQTGYILEENSQVTIKNLSAKLSLAAELPVSLAIAFKICFEILFCFKNSGLSISEFSDIPSFYQNSISRIYLNLCDPIEGFENSWRKLSGIRRRLHIDRFNSDAIAQLSLVKFMLGVGVAIYQQICNNDKSLVIKSILLAHIQSISFYDYIHGDYYKKLKALLTSSDTVETDSQTRCLGCKPSSKKILITGSHGMVGHNLVDHLRSINCAYTLLTPTHNECDLLDRASVSPYLSEYKPDVIIHCAGTVGGIQANVANPVKFLYENMQMGLNLVLEAFEHKIPRLINLGSSCMYPYAAPNPLKEDMVLCGALEPTNEGYALAKCAITRLCQYINRTNSNIQYKTLIPCNLYGPYDKFDERAHMIPAIIKKIDTAITVGSDSVEIWGDGTARREFMYAGDLAHCIALAIERFDDLPELMNVGLGYDYTIDEYYQKIGMILGYSGSFVHNTEKPSGMKQKLVDISLQTKFGFKPKTSLEEGIRKTYEYYKSLQTK